MKNESFSVGRRRLAAVLSVLAVAPGLVLTATRARAAGTAAGTSAAGTSTRETAAAGARTLLVLGDSLSAEYGLPRGSGWVALLEQRLASQAPGWTVVNASISGETTAGGASRIERLLDRHTPAVVVVELGGNDALRGLDLAATERNLERIVSSSRAAGAHVLVLGMEIPPNYGRAYTEAFAKLFHDVAERQKVALVPFFLEAIAGQGTRYFQADRIHPTEEAQALMLETIWPTLKNVLARATPG
jgi:acyl-CoA thioesterase-1